MNAGRMLLALAVAVALACGGLFAWHQWWRPSGLSRASISDCPGALAGLRSGWSGTRWYNDGSAALTVQDVRLHVVGASVERIVAVRGEALQSNPPRLAVDAPEVWAKREPVRGALIRPGEWLDVYTEFSWPGERSFVVDRMWVTVASSDGGTRTVAGEDIADCG